MIKIEAVHIEEFRGIRELTLQMDRESFLVRGPNGSGKSGVVDAIEFALTGEISRLTGRGTGGLSVGMHGPHVDHQDNPEAAFVALKIFIPELDKSATITRRVKQPREPVIEPDDDDVRRVLNEAFTHPELTLTRREVIKFILTEATKRSQDVQALLRLDSIDQTRGTLKTAQNKLGSALSSAETRRVEDNDTLRRHLDVEKLSAESILSGVNVHRGTLGLALLTELTATTALDQGVTTAGGSPKPALDKASAGRNLAAFSEVLATLSDRGATEASSILHDIQELEGKPELATALKQRELVQSGLALLIDPSCPLCDTAWDMEELRQHLAEKLDLSQEGQAVQDRMRSNAEAIANEASRIQTLVDTVRELSTTLGEDGLGDVLSVWSEDLRSFSEILRGTEDVSAQKSQLAAGWTKAPDGIETCIAGLVATVEGLPDESASMVAAAFLTRAQVHLGSLRVSKYKEASARRRSEAARAVYKAYCEAAEAELTDLYQAVEEKFSSYYRQINAADEKGFKAKLEPSRGKLDLSVDFYERGMFPPGAYHSEGHQDGMGVCLYLALMSHLLGERFSLCVLDDVVMSVDSEHRREFCHLLKKEFPNTQFVITTHDRVWGEQMRSVGLVTSKSTVAFYGWTIDSGPIVEGSAGAWADIEAEIQKDNISNASGTLRRHLEAVSRELAGQIVANVPYRPDLSYDLGDLLPNVLKRMNVLLGKAAKAAQSWGNDDAKEAVTKHKKALSEAAEASNCEQWTINAAVHYNEWANLSRQDFEPVVASFQALLSQFRCDNQDCRSWIYVTPIRGTADALRCTCGRVNHNLRDKPKD